MARRGAVPRYQQANLINANPKVVALKRNNVINVDFAARRKVA